MIPLRQHVASLVAVFLALAVGIALGGGPLASSDEPAEGGPATDRDDQPTPAADDGAAYADAFAGEGAARLYADGLNGHAAAVLAMPGADQATVKALQGQIVAAGGAITGTYSVGARLVDPAEKDSIDQVSAALVTQLGDPRVDPFVSTYERMGALLALAMATTEPTSTRADLAAVAVREALSDAELLQSPDDVRNAPLVLVVLPPGEDGAESSLATRTILAGLVGGIGSLSAGEVVVGDADSAEGGELAALRDGELVGPISTVDGVETTIGQVTTVLAMIAVVSGTAGSYGASGADGVVPLG